MAEKANLYELCLDRLEKEGPQGDRKNYARKIKSLERQLDEARMWDDEPSDDKADLSDSSHAHFEGDDLNNKYNKNRVRQRGHWKRNKTKKRKNETLNNEYVRATPYAIVDTVANVRIMLLQSLVPTSTTRVITFMTRKVRESPYELESHADTCVFVQGTLIVYDFNQPVNVQEYNPSLGSSE